MLKKFVLIIFIITFSGCSSIKMLDRKSNNEGMNHENVDLNLDNNTRPSEDKSAEIPRAEETVRIGGESGGNIFSNHDTETQAENIGRKVRIGINFGPGVNRVFSYISILKILDKQNFSPEIITGTELGAIVAVMYASGMTPEMIEWNFYKYFKEKRNKKLFEEDWIEDLDTFFLSKFKNSNLQDTKKKCFLTLFDHNTKKTYYFDKGNIRDLLLLNLRLSNNVIESKNRQKYTSAIEKEVFNAKLLKNLGADFTLAVDALGTNFELENQNEFLYGVYSKVSGRISKEKKEFDFVITLPIQQMKLDSTKDSPLYLQKSLDFMQKIIPQMSKKIHDKNESKDRSGSI